MGCLGMPARIIISSDMASEKALTAMLYFKIFTSLACAAQFLVPALAAPFSHSGSGNATIETVYQFPNESWVENIAVRGNGNVLVTLITSPEVWEVDPTTHTAELIYSFPDATAATGITEVTEDVFAVAIGNWSVVTAAGTKGSWSIWTIDYRSRQSWHKHHGPPSTRKVAEIQEAVFINGLTALPTLPDTVLAGDSELGLVNRVNTRTGSHSVAIQDSAFAANTTAAALLGINGIHVRDNYLYFTNSFSSSLVFGRIPISSNGFATGSVQTIVATPRYPTNIGYHADDFALDGDGNAWITTDASSTLVKATPGGNVTIIEGGPQAAVVAGCTSAAFGRTRGKRVTLYITTNGGLVVPPVGGIVGGKVLALNTRGL
ncbi:hypothetical protein LTR42_002127 [Elasticomyces elasticus]|nr:hypothetical protein LTR42_002127 [Elasticomyces elasticus]